MVEVEIYYHDCKNMSEVEDNTIRLVITSPPYYNYKDYQNKTDEQIGGIKHTYERYISDLKDVWKECFRKLIPGGKLCINVPNMKSRKAVEGESFLYPIIADVTKSCLSLGYIFFDEIIWVKGNANAGALGGKPLFGSYPYPPNFKILDSIQEDILIFKKPGEEKKIDKEIKEKSKLTKREWIDFTNGVWMIQPEKQDKGHCAVFPIEIPHRLIKLYSFVGEKILDPFLGSGTTLLACKLLERNGVGYEINKDYKPIIDKKINLSQQKLSI
jgi:site-specific DNA-methyltransferase (adenine-specific)